MQARDRETSLPEALEIAERLHGYLTEFHPQRSGKLAELIDKTTDDKRRDKLGRLEKFLSLYDADNMSEKTSKRWINQDHLFAQLGRDFLETKGRAPANTTALLEYLLSIISDDLTISFNTQARKTELSYEVVLNRVSRKIDGKGIKLPAGARECHDFTYGDRQSLSKWLKSSESRDFRQALPARIAFYKANSQVFALAQIRKSSAGTIAPFLPRQLRRQLDENIFTDQELSLSRTLKWPIDHVIGLTHLFDDERAVKKFSPETFHKIRNFMAYEFADIRELNRSAALMALTFPDYNNFTKYILNKAVFNPDTQSLDLHKMVDTDKFYFGDNDYLAWGELLLDQGPSRLFYLKTAHLLDFIPRNDKGKILTGGLDKQLYNQVAELVGFCSDYDCERYKDLKIVRDVLSIKKIKAEYQDELESQKDEMIGLKDIHIEGERFGKPGWRFGRLSYNDDRFFVVGRFTKSCEYIDGHWGDTVKEGYRNRSSTFYCLFDENDRILAHSWTYRRMDTLDILFDGFEADQNEVSVNDQLLSKIIEEIKKDRPNQKFDIGTSAAQFRRLESISTIIPGEEDPNHVKIVDQNQIFDVNRIVESAEIPPYTQEEAERFTRLFGKQPHFKP